MEKKVFPKWNANILLPNGERFARIRGMGGSGRIFSQSKDLGYG